MTQLEISQVVAAVMETQRLRVTHVKRSWSTVQTAVDNAVVSAFMVVGQTREHATHFKTLQMTVGQMVARAEDERKAVLMGHRVSWAVHKERYRDWIIVMSLALKFSVHDFERSRFQRLLIQHKCAGACELGLTMAQIIESNVYSGVYCLFSLGRRATYWGKWHGSSTWTNSHRLEQHAKATIQASQGLTSERKYIYMNDNGGAHRWWSFPMITIVGPISKHQLSRIEKAEYLREPRPLNLAGIKGKKVTLTNGSSRHPLRNGNPPKLPRLVEAQLFGIPTESSSNELVPYGDIGQMVKECKLFRWHASRVSEWTPVCRMWGKSEVILSSDSGTEKMFLSSAVRKRGLHGWCQVVVINRHRHYPSRSEAYVDLLTIAKHEYGSGQGIYNALTIDELWRLWMISEVNCSARVHQKNKRHIGRTLRSRKCRLLPDTRLVYTIPSGVQATKREIISSVRNSIKKSTIHLTITDHILNNLWINRPPAPTLRSLLDTHGQAVKALHDLGSLPCSCCMYPNLPMRHGHVFMPSWDCEGQVGADVLELSMSSRIYETCDAYALAKTTNSWLHKWFPAELLGRSEFKYLAANSQRPLRASPLKQIAPFTKQQVMKVRHHYEYLVGVVVDKAPGRLLYVCPQFYAQRYYDPTFPVRSDPARYLPTGKSSEQLVEEKRQVFVKKKWYDLATQCYDARVAMPYVLPKHKDIIADCEEVFKKKGKCCRARPIIPYTFDQWRRLYKKVGAILLYIENRIPRSQCAIVSNTAQVVRALSEGVDRATAKYQHSNFKWVLAVGDVANMYDELDHESVNSAMSWLMDGARSWLHRRTRGDTGFSVTPWGKVTEGRSQGDNREVYFDSQTILDICQEDNEYCCLIDRGEVIKKKLGCPMGGLLSPRKANTTLARSEWAIFDLARCLGLVMILVRYMDDVLCAIAYESENERGLAECILVLLRGSYPYPLDLQWEKRSSSYPYLEMEVLTAGHRIWGRFLSKAGVAAQAKDTSFVRVPNGWDGHKTLDRFRYFRNTLIRICDCCTCPMDVYHSAVFVAIELLANKWSKCEVCTTLAVVANQRLNEQEGQAIMTARMVVEWKLY